MIRLWEGDCLEQLRRLRRQSVDLILADPPYGTTQNPWDSVIPLGLMWAQLGRVIKPGRPIVLFAGEPFTSTLICSKREWFRYRWTWNKVNRITGYLDAKRRPLRIVEDLVAFSTKGHPSPYHPQMVPGATRFAVEKGGDDSSRNYGKHFGLANHSEARCPTDLLSIPALSPATEGRTHGTQKPVAVCEYMIKTYSDPGAVVLDFCMGSGTAGVACARLGRGFIGIERDPAIFRGAKRRVEAAYETGFLIPSQGADECTGLFGNS